MMMSIDNLQDIGDACYLEDFPWDDFDDEVDEFSCDNCGPWCEHWGGDGLCMLAIAQSGAENEHYEANFVTPNVTCPECGKILTMYEIPVDELWLWPGDFYNPMIALDIFAVYDAPKGEIHRHGDLCHIWVGTGEHRRECLILLSGKDGLAKYQSLQSSLHGAINEALEEKGYEIEPPCDGIPF
jgi:hypothetical protein